MTARRGQIAHCRRITLRASALRAILRELSIDHHGQIEAISERLALPKNTGPPRSETGESIFCVYLIFCEKGRAHQPDFCLFGVCLSAHSVFRSVAATSFHIGFQLSVLFGVCSLDTFVALSWLFWLLCIRIFGWVV